ncbi:TPA: ATP-binding protein [Vibrio parahaemolyticus]|uniref:AAA family ATPase n=5 Tax=Vibrio parahaemolyticus TaxID=670 RepID=UPI00111D3D35|nr:AAA family ATPase [Vibrio parahaemolyticus]MDF4357141.1 AAA family ATPase [Vibrio parahaemolyticus]MDF4545584.1 AAA family ATPase [Vibrio parahaemolyticus]MDG2580393.1 AAA family ATPase [Vibrio parahaemolyticus]MDG2799651.1 AAA family ATPase [Vibrio parahaemolyticus]MEA5265739.1 AAA family ATPase [Vibrio parahaemolyticus]
MKKIDLNIVNHNSLAKVFIGENGGGKSSVLRQLADYYISNGRLVLGISNCLHDKFDINSRKFKCLSVKQGELAYNRVVVDALSKIENNKVRFVLGRALDYCGYIDEIGIKLPEYDNINSSEIYWIPINNDYPSLGYNNKSNLIVSFLNGTKIDYKVEVFLKNKNGEVVPFEMISSGQANKIATLTYIASNMRDGLVIVVDEPENSLHPKWQREYIDNIFNVFYGEYFKLLVATHSPLIIGSNCDVYEVSNFKIADKPDGNQNIEEKLWSLFGVVTPENDFLSRYLIDILDSYRRGASSRVLAVYLLDEISKSCIDERQIRIIDDVKNIINGCHEEF